MSQKLFYEIFKPGIYPQGDFPASFCEQVAANYDPTFSEAPVTPDHAISGPALGWVDGCKFDDGVLKVSFGQVSDAMVAAIAQGEYKKVSAEFVQDLGGKGPYLYAVSLLGAQHPAVLGLKPITFANASTAVVKFEAEFVPMPLAAASDVGGVQAPATSEAPQTPAPVIPAVAAFADENDPVKLKAMLVEANTKVATFASQVTEMSARISSNDVTQRRLSFETFLAERIEYGSLNDECKAHCLKLLSALDGVAKFSTGESPVDVLKAFINALPKFAPGGEIATRVAALDGLPVGGVNTFGANVDPERLALHNKITAFAAQRKITYEQAAAQLTSKG